MENKHPVKNANDISVVDDTTQAQNADPWLSLVDNRFETMILGWLDIRRTDDGTGALIDCDSESRAPTLQSSTQNGITGIKRIEINCGEHNISAFLRQRLGWLKISPQLADDGKAGLFRKPFPQNALPFGIDGFKRIDLYCYTYDVLAFFHRIRRLLDGGITMMFGYRECMMSSCCPHRDFWRLLANKIIKLHLIHKFLSEFRYSVSASFLGDLVNLRSIETKIFVKFPADDILQASSGQVLAKWLLTSLSNGRPKLLTYNLFNYSTPEPKSWPIQLMESLKILKEVFTNANTAVSFIICLKLADASDLEEFVLENEQTRERMTLREIGGTSLPERPLKQLWLWLLVRAPIEKDSNRWTQWEHEALNSRHLDAENQIHVFFRGSMRVMDVLQ